MPSRLLVLSLGGALLLLSCPCTGSATSWTVNPDGSGDATTIKGGLAIAVEGDTVSVAAGTYYERQIVMKSGVVLTSETGQADCVTVDPQGLGRGFYCVGTIGGAIIGFTVRNGNAAYGGGLFCVSLSTPDIVNCAFTDCTALVGGGAYLHHSPVLVMNTIFSRNRADYFGGGVAVEDYSDPTFVSCTFTDNEAPDGAGVWLYLYSYPTLQDCDVSGNRAAAMGGGVHCTSADPTLRGCRITGNTAPRGGGLAVWTGAPTVTGCTIAGNRATEEGGGILAGEGASVDVTNTVVWGNCAPTGGQVLAVAGSSSVDFGCSDVDDGPGAVAGAGSVSWNGTNFHDDPLFCLPAPCLAAPTTGGEYRVAPASSCAAANSGGCGPIGALGEGACGAQAFAVQSRSWGEIKSYYRSGDGR